RTTVRHLPHSIAVWRNARNGRDPADLAYGYQNLLGRPLTDVNLRTSGGELARDVRADPPPAARDERILAVKLGQRPRSPPTTPDFRATTGRRGLHRSPSRAPRAARSLHCVSLGER